MIQRKDYLNQLISWKDEQVIKVITGIRRCGKSTMIKLFHNNYVTENIVLKFRLKIAWSSRHNGKMISVKTIVMRTIVAQFVQTENPVIHLRGRTAEKITRESFFIYVLHILEKERQCSETEQLHNNP